MVQNKHKGTLNEQIVKLHLLREGLDVFENISPHGVVDLISRNPETGELILYDVSSVIVYHKVDGTVTYSFPKDVKKHHSLNIVIVGVLENGDLIFSNP